jgi:hypothetical protein
MGPFPLPKNTLTQAAGAPHRPDGTSFTSSRVSYVSSYVSPGVYLRLEHVRCEKKGGKKCSGENPKLHGPYWYPYRTKKGGKGRTSEYVGKALPVGTGCPTGWPRSSAS